MLDIKVQLTMSTITKVALAGVSVSCFDLRRVIPLTIFGRLSCGGTWGRYHEVEASEC